jgi:hypothetical protein
MPIVFPDYFSATFAELYHFLTARTLVSEYQELARLVDSDDARSRSSTDITQEYSGAHMDMLTHTKKLRTLWQNVRCACTYENYVDLEDQYHSIVWFGEDALRSLHESFRRILSDKAKRVTANNVQIIFYRCVCADVLSAITAFL